ncbi:MAG: cytochrome c oxidase subunit 3, partial [Terricaulis sp.]
MAHGDVKHDYHLVNPSPWPFVASIGALVAAVGAVVLMRGLSSNEADFFFGKGHWTLFLVGMGILIITCIGWWGDVIKESRGGDHTPVVDIGLRYGMILFIASEVMFFVAWFWMFFELAIFHGHRADWIVPTWDAATTAAWANWPPPHVETFDPFHLPLMNTLILLLSGTTVTWAHHALQTGDRNGARNGLILTVLL